jgi:hypothetical protein
MNTDPRSNLPEASAAESEQQHIKPPDGEALKILTDEEKRARADAMRELLRKTRSEQRVVTSEEAYAQYLRSIEPPSKWIRLRIITESKASLSTTCS